MCHVRDGSLPDSVKPCAHGTSLTLSFCLPFAVVAKDKQGRSLNTKLNVVHITGDGDDVLMCMTFEAQDSGEFHPILLFTNLADSGAGGGG